jgi:putative proteasome-type protease
MFTILSSGSLSLTQSVMTRLEQDFRAGDGLASVANFYEAARCVGQQVRAVGSLDREYMERDNINFSVNLLVGGQIRGESPQLYLIYAQGNPLRCTRLSPFLRFGETTLDQAVTYAIISLDSTMRSNVAVGPPIDLLVYANDDLAVKRYRRLDASDPALGEIRSSWEQALRHAIKTVPQIHFADAPPREQLGMAFTREAERSVGGAG